MKKIYITFAALVFATVLNASTNIFVVDMKKVHENYYKAKAASAQLQASAKASSTELQAMAKTREEKIVALQAIDEKLKNPAMTEDAKKELAQKEANPLIQEVRQIEQNIQAMQQQAQQRLQQNAQQIAATHREEIVEVIQKVAADKKADFVLEKQVAYFSKDSSDLTEAVITELNKSAPLEAPTK